LGKTENARQGTAAKTKEAVAEVERNMFPPSVIRKEKRRYRKRKPTHKRGDKEHVQVKRVRVKVSNIQFKDQG